MKDALTRRSVIALVLFAATSYGSLFLFPESSGTASNIFSVVGDALALLIICLGIRRWPEKRQLAWKLFAASVAFCLLGDIVWAVEEEVFGIEIEVPSYPDVIYLLSVIANCFALFQYVRDEKTIDLTTTGFDILISIVATGIIFYNYIVSRVENFQEMAAWRAAIVLSYPVTDVAYLMGFFSLVFGKSRQSKLKIRNLLLGVGTFLMFLADQSYLFQSLFGDVAGALVDPIWPLCFGMIALASLQAPDWMEIAAEETEETENGPVWLEYSRMLLPYGLTVVILLMVGVHYDLLGSTFFIGAMVLLVLLSVRQVIVLVGNRKLLLLVSENEREMNRKNQELQKLTDHFMMESETDFLTKLLNRRAIVQAFERLKPTGDDPETLGILLVDVDYFKHINDTFGHQKGDDALVGVAESIRHTIRGHDVGGRFGGDEFLVLLPGANEAAVEAVAQRLRAATQRHETLAEMKVTLSIGGASWSVGKEDYRPNKLLRHADEALYVAKEKGRDQYVMYSEHLENEI